MAGSAGCTAAPAAAPAAATAELWHAAACGSSPGMQAVLCRLLLQGCHLVSWHIAAARGWQSLQRCRCRQAARRGRPHGQPPALTVMLLLAHAAAATRLAGLRSCSGSCKEAREARRTVEGVAASGLLPVPCSCLGPHQPGQAAEAMHIPCPATTDTDSQIQGGWPAAPEGAGSEEPGFKHFPAPRAVTAHRTGRPGQTTSCPRPSPSARAAAGFSACAAAKMRLAWTEEDGGAGVWCSGLGRRARRRRAPEQLLRAPEPGL